VQHEYAHHQEADDAHHLPENAVRDSLAAERQPIQDLGSCDYLTGKEKKDILDKCMYKAEDICTCADAGLSGASRALPRGVLVLVDREGLRTKACVLQGC